MNGWTRREQARRESTTWTSHYCSLRGCGRNVYSGGLCSEHWDPPEVTTCGHAAPVVGCGCCGRRVCVDCYGEWNALACRACRDKARGQVA